MEERTAHWPSDVDAMGLDKRRRVRGGTYGPTRARIAARFLIAFALVVALVVAAKIAIDELDEAPASAEREAPWADPDAPQRPPKSLQ